MENNKEFLRKIKRTANKILGTKSDELYWRFRHFFDRSWAKSYISHQSISHSHREFLISNIAKHSPFESILEIGCASGPNLSILSELFPKVKLYGIDISASAIKTGKRFFLKNDIRNIFLKQSRAEDLSAFKDKSIGIIFTDAVLIYLGPDKINLAIKEMLRVAKKGIILCEQNREGSGLSFYKDHWVHNYKLLFGKFLSPQKIKITKIPPEIWGGDWGKLGCIIEIKL